MPTRCAYACVTSLLILQSAGTVLAQARPGSSRTQAARPRVSAPSPMPGPLAPGSRRLKPLAVSSSLWKPLGESRGKRPIQGIKIGSGDFRVLIVGSLAGNDAPALSLVDQLASKVVQNATIIGGFRSIIVRSGNPDGVALKRATNAANVKITTAFLPEGSSATPEPEVQILTRLLRTYKPHRVLHVTTGSIKSALVLHNDYGRDAGLELAGWLSVQTKSTKRFAPIGSMEQFIGESAEVVTLVLPKGNAMSAEKIWNQYGDSVLASLAPNAPADDWPPPTAWNRERKDGARVYRSGGTAIEKKSP